MTGEQLKPLSGRPYLESWQERMAEPVKVKRKKGKVARK